MSRLSNVLIDDATLDSVMQLVIALAVTSIGPADAASVSVLRGDDDRFETANSTSGDVVDLDAVQYRSEQGPCVTAIRSGRDVQTQLDEHAEAWPEFVRAALGRDVTSVFSKPLWVRERVMGALNLYSYQPDAGGRWPGDTITQFAESTAVVLANATAFMTTVEQNENLRRALMTRELIGQAKGIVMERHGLDAEDAFDWLRVRSQHENRKLYEIAQDVVDEAAAGRERP